MRTFGEIKSSIDTAFNSNNVDVLLRDAEELDGLSSPKAEALACSSRGWALYLRGDYPAALVHFHRALALNEELGNLSGVAHVTNNIGIVLGNTGDYPAALEHFQRALALSEKLGDLSGVANITRGIGLVHWSTGDYPAALENFHRALTLFEELSDASGVAKVTDNIGTVHSAIGDYPAAIEHFHRAMAIHEELSDSSGMSRVTNHIGILHFVTGDYPSALEHYHRALSLNEDLGDRSGVASLTGNIGSVHLDTGDYPSALEHFHHSLALHEELGERSGVALVTGNIGLVLQETGDYSAALEHFHRALALHEELGELSGVARVTVNIGNVHQGTGDYPAALDFYNEARELYEVLGELSGVARVTGNLLAAHVTMGSVAEAQELLATMDAMHIDKPEVRINRELQRSALQQHNADLENAVLTLYNALAEAQEHGLRLLAADIHKSLRDLALKQNNLAGYVEHNNEYTRITEEINGKDTTTKLAMQTKQREIDAVQREHQKHLAVLHSTLPKHIADRVARGETVNDHFDNAAVLFLDVVGFTTHSSTLDAGIVVQLLQDMFTTFDAICAEHNVMKIKTIGDSYMAVAFDVADAVGARPRLAREQTETANQIANSEQRIANVALAMLSSEFVWPHTGERVMFRIGIHCGPVVAGVLGTQRMQYDVWGDTVNVASRMESTSEPGKIHVSEALAKALNEHKNSPPSPLSHASLERGSFTIVPRGTIDVKGKGTMQTYWLEGA